MNAIAQKDDQKPNSPKKVIQVKREYDENGNLIKFDSVYTYSWSSDTTLQKSISPDKFPEFFNGDSFRFESDSTFWGDSFLKDFDPFFDFSHSKQDSLMMKKFGMNHRFQNFDFKNDSLAMNFKDFDDFFNNFNEVPNDSILSKIPQFKQPQSMNELMKMLQKQMGEMEEQQRRFFKKDPKIQEF